MALGFGGFDAPNDRRLANRCRPCGGLDRARAQCPAPRQVEAGNPAIAEYLRYRSEGHLVGRYH
jgi:hypothetical protein